MSSAVGRGLDAVGKLKTGDEQHKKSSNQKRLVGCGCGKKMGKYRGAFNTIRAVLRVLPYCRSASTPRRALSAAVSRRPEGRQTRRQPDSGGV